MEDRGRIRLVLSRRHYLWVDTAACHSQAERVSSRRSFGGFEAVLTISSSLLCNFTSWGTTPPPSASSAYQMPPVTSGICGCLWLMVLLCMLALS